MVELEKSQEIIEKTLRNYAQIPYSHGEMKNYLLIDANKTNFLLMTIGWDGKKRIHGCLIHIEIKNDKIWIQRDGTEDGITNELLTQGIAKEQIVLAFYPSYLRPHTEFAVQ